MPLWFEHRELSGRAEKRLACGYCQCVFSYQLLRTVAYDSPLFPGSPKLLQATCERQLAKRLAADVEPVSCPCCGYIQPGMIHELRSRFLRKMRKIGAVMMVVSLTIVAMIGLGAAWVTLGQISMRGVDVDWSGLISCCLSGALAGSVLAGTGNVLARVRYPSIGFMPRTTLRNADADVTVLTPPRITPLAQA